MDKNNIYKKAVDLIRDEINFCYYYSSEETYERNVIDAIGIIRGIVNMVKETENDDQSGSKR